jgi:ABC-type sugar transport system ATPase subunit
VTDDREAMDAAIEIRGLTKRFGKTLALDSVNLTVEEGEFLVLLGPSGCGKSTLLRSLAGLEMPDEGEIAIGGKVMFSSRRGISVAPGDRQLGMVFQSYALWPHMTVADNVGFGLQVRQIPKQETRTRVSAVLRDLAMEGLESRYPSELSGGQQQRVALARLLATKPPIFLMDEPLSNLDARLRMDMRSELKRLHQATHATTVFVTHDQTEAMSLATLVAVMNEGRIEQVAPPRILYRRPANLFVADFVGLPRINVLHLRVGRLGGKVWLENEDFRIPVSWGPSRNSVVVAAKPEDITLSLRPAEDAVAFEVSVIHPTGPDLIVQVKRGDLTLVVRETRNFDLAVGQTVWAKFDAAAINLYDETSGVLLTAEDSEESASGKAVSA